MRDGITPTVKSIAVIGAGIMGHDIARIVAGAGYRVILRAEDLDTLACVQAIERNPAKSIQPGKLTEADRHEALQYIRGIIRLEETVRAYLLERRGRYTGVGSDNRRRFYSWNKGKEDTRQAHSSRGFGALRCKR